MLNRVSEAVAAPRAGKAVRIASTATAVPPYTLEREDVKKYVGKVFSIEPDRLNALMTVIDNAQVNRRYCIFPVDYIIEPRPLAQITREYQEHAIILGKKVAAAALERAGMQATDIDMIVTVSCTGVIIPSLDAHLINELGFRTDVRRLPINELGCAAGAAALTRALEFIRAYPGASVLVVSVELPTLTFQRGDLSQANLISCVLFGDGAAAAVITGRPNSGPSILDSSSYFFPQSIDAMGFELKDTGFHIVLSRDVPQMIRDKIGGLVKDFLARHSLEIKQIPAYVLHPGGQKLLSYIEEELGLCRCTTQFSWDVLHQYGNLSSATVLFVLQEWLESKKLKAGEHALLAAFGPGFCAEMLLLQWN
ncbi:MAG: type III polyketide synthase [Candidatus Acidiferrales bacterium]